MLLIPKVCVMLWTVEFVWLLKCESACKGDLSYTVVSIGVSDRGLPFGGLIQYYRRS